MAAKNSPVLITGAAGAIGSSLSLKLRLAGYRIVACDQLAASHVDIVSDYSGLDLASLCHDENFTIIHLAAHNDLRRSYLAPDEYFLNNIQKPSEFFKKNIRYIDHIIYPSSCSIYDGDLSVAISETSAISPQSPYSHSKYALERFLVSLAGSLRISICRTFNVVSPQMSYLPNELTANRIVPALFRAASMGSAFEIFGGDFNTSDGTCIRDYLHCDDFADLISCLLDYKGSPNPIIVNAGTGIGCSVREMHSLFCEVNRAQIPVDITPRRPGDVSCRIANCDLAYSILGWKPKRSISSIFSARTISEEICEKIKPAMCR